MSAHVLPLTVFVLLPSTCIVTYIVSVTLGHVNPCFPYISDMVKLSPESCIFSQMLNMVSFMLAITMYVRYRMIDQFFVDHESLRNGYIRSRNWISFRAGCIACLGLSIVANFQVSKVGRVHTIGAWIAFTFSQQYMWFQSLLSFQMLDINSARTAKYRLLLSCTMTCSYITHLVCARMAHVDFDGLDRTHWSPTDGGYNLHVISAVAEWISMLCISFFILTFVREMQLISLSCPRVTFFVESLLVNDASGDKIC